MRRVTRLTAARDDIAASLGQRGFGAALPGRFVVGDAVFDVWLPSLRR
jgi:hypothetical protein